MHRISYSGRHPPMCKYLDWSSLHGMQRLSSVSTSLPGHHLTQKLNWDWRSYQEAQQPQSPPMATYFCPWVSSLQIFMNQIPLEKQPGQLSLVLAHCTACAMWWKHRANPGTSKKVCSACHRSDAGSKCTWKYSLALWFTYD